MCFRRDVRDFVSGHADPRQRRRLEREGLRGPRFLTGHIARRNRAFLYTPDGLPSETVQYVEKAVLGKFDDGRNPFAVLGRFNQGRRRRYIEVE